MYKASVLFEKKNSVQNLMHRIHNMLGIFGGNAVGKRSARESSPYGLAEISYSILERMK